MKGTYKYIPIFIRTGVEKSAIIANAVEQLEKSTNYLLNNPRCHPSLPSPPFPQGKGGRRHEEDGIWQQSCNAQGSNLSYEYFGPFAQFH
jgi:hypothetical protein